MKTVKIEFEVEVPDRYKYVTMSEYGLIWAHTDKPQIDEAEGTWECHDGPHVDEIPVDVKNWRETLTKVNHDDGIKAD